MSEIWNSKIGLLPQISEQSFFLFRISYASMMLLSLFHMIPMLKYFFLTEKYNGYADHKGLNTFVQKPSIFFPLFVLWIASQIMVLCNQNVLLASAINLVLCYFFFIHQRWTSLLRGAGAPGFMSWWGGMALFLLTLTHESETLFAWTALTIQVDFAIVMLSAGIYKMTAGYVKGTGMELGLINPVWGYWWKFYSSLNPRNFIFWLYNQLAWTTEVFAAVLMLIPETRWLGAFFIFASFAFIVTHIRLNMLCEVVMACCFLFIDQRDVIHKYAMSHLEAPSFSSLTLPESVQSILFFLVVAYLLFRPISLMGLYYNFYGRKRLPEKLQWLFERFTNIFGIILWRVFTKEVTNFYIEIESKSKNSSAPAKKIANYESFFDWRFNHVAEAIAITTIFTALKYFSNDPSIFEKRLLRYSKTLPRKSNELLIYRYVSIQKDQQFVFVPTFETIVDLEKGTLQTVILNEEAMKQFHTKSMAALNCAAPGTYAPTT